VVGEDVRRLRHPLKWEAVGEVAVHRHAQELELKQLHACACLSGTDAASDDQSKVVVVVVLHGVVPKKDGEALLDTVHLNLGPAWYNSQCLHELL